MRKEELAEIEWGGELTDTFTLTSLKPPEYSGPDWITVKSDDGAREVRFRFIDAFHLILEAGRDLVFKDAKVGASGPDTFVYSWGFTQTILMPTGSKSISTTLAQNLIWTMTIWDGVIVIRFAYR